MVLSKSSVFDSADCDCIFLHNSGKENVPIYVGCADAVNPKPEGGLGVIIRFKAPITTKFLGYLIPNQCVKIHMGKNSKSFLEVISVAELYMAYKNKNPRHTFKQIVPK
jgi:hypothetical protein